MFLTLLMACGPSPKPTAGLTHTALAVCPNSPNCVSTQADPSDTRHYIAPIRLAPGSDPASVIDRAVRVGAAMPRSQVLTVGADTAHMIFKTAIFRWIDDVEFAVDADEGLLHFRSASRRGYSDLGVNRKRMESFRAAFAGTP